MKTILLILLVSLTAHLSYAQTDQGKEFYSKEFKWRIKIPEGFQSVPPEEWKKLQDRGTEMIQKNMSEEVENHSTLLFIVRTNQFNYFEANYQPFDTVEDGNFTELVNALNQVVYQTFESQMPNAKLDSASSFETIGGKEFHKYTLTMTMSQTMSLEVVMYTRLFGKKQLTINIMAIDKEKRKALLEAWRNSKFE